MGTAIRELYFLPPLAVARLGGSDTPLASFHWVADPGIHAGGRTVIQPAVTFEVQEDGSICPVLPQEIRFSDAGRLRPVAPFFEVWVTLAGGAAGKRQKPLTLALLDALGVSLRDVRFRITVANKKAQRRTQNASCGFMAWADVRGDDHVPVPLKASSPMDPDHPPLVLREKPISLGSFQVIRPIEATHTCADGSAIDLSVVRVRFTPAKGHVYGPPGATATIPSPLPEGEDQAWRHVMQGRLWDVVLPQENRILNPDALWTRYTMDKNPQTDPQPEDSYDGARVGRGKSLGVVDDTCDGVLEAHLVVKGRRYSGTARITVGPPDYAPDRRHFLSAADDLADRDLSRVEVPAERAEAERELVDLLVRVFETASQINLDAERYKFISGQAGYDGVSGKDGEAGKNMPPLTNFDSMTGEDKTPGPPPISYADLATDLIPPQGFPQGGGYPNAAEYAGHARAVLAFTDLARTAHAKLAQPHYLLEFLRTRADHVRDLVRAPYGHFSDLDTVVKADDKPKSNLVTDADPVTRFRDPRNSRDKLHDMRMPPYMRDSDDSALSLTWRQYALLMDFIKGYLPAPKVGPGAKP